MPHGSGIGSSGQIPPTGVARSSAIWVPTPQAFTLPVLPTVGQSSDIGIGACQTQVGGALLLLLPVSGSAAAIDSDTLSFLNAQQAANPGYQVKILSRATMGLAGGYTLTGYGGHAYSIYAGSTGVHFPKINGATHCHMQGFTVQSGDIEQTNSNSFNTPGPYLGWDNCGLNYGSVDDFGFPFAGLIGSDPTVSPGFWDGTDVGTALFPAAIDGPAYSATATSDALVPLGGGFRGFRAASSIFAGFAASLSGTWTAKFALYFTWWKLDPYDGTPPDVGVDLTSIKASDRGGCC